jgi:circadian clock protein KaiC
MLWVGGASVYRRALSGSKMLTISVPPELSLDLLFFLPYGVSKVRKSVESSALRTHPAEPENSRSILRPAAPCSRREGATFVSTAQLSPNSVLAPRPARELPKAATGISGLDEVTGGGLPRSRPTLVCGPAGCGKTMLAMEFLVRGITEFGEPGVFVSFEETVDELVENVTSMGFDLEKLQDDGLLVMDHVNVAPCDLTETGEWDLSGLFIRLAAAIDAVGAKRVVLDTIDTLFGAFDNSATLRAELARLFSWLKERGVTAVVTGERGDGTLTRHGIEEYVSDCVIVLDHRVSEQTSTRRLRVLKYRGSLHGTNEYPFLIGRTGISVLPITSLGLQHPASHERVSAGVESLDAMLGGGAGLFRGSSVMISGTAGTGKSTIAAQFCAAACARGERALYFAFEESQAQIVRNMTSVGIDLAHWVDEGFLQFRCIRPSLMGLEAHFASMQQVVSDFAPDVVVMDPVSDLLQAGGGEDVSLLLTRQVDYLKSRGVTALFTSLNTERDVENSEQQIGSLIDTWIITKLAKGDGTRKRVLYVLKSRGMSHSHEIREFLLSEHGLELADVYHAVGVHA